MFSIETKKLIHWLKRNLFGIACRKVHDYCWAYDTAELGKVLAQLDDRGYELVCVAEMDPGKFMVFFRRPVL